MNKRRKTPPTTNSSETSSKVIMKESGSCKKQTKKTFINSVQKPAHPECFAVINVF